MLCYLLLVLLYHHSQFVERNSHANSAPLARTNWGALVAVSRIGGAYTVVGISDDNDPSRSNGDNRFAPPHSSLVVTRRPSQSPISWPPIVMASTLRHVGLASITHPRQIGSSFDKEGGKSALRLTTWQDEHVRRRGLLPPRDCDTKIPPSGGAPWQPTVDMKMLLLLPTTRGDRTGSVREQWK